MAYEVSRRSFLKGAAALAVATAASGLLTACGGGKEDNGFTVGKYKVYFDSPDFGTSDAQGNHFIEPNLKIECIKTDYLDTARDFDKVFSAKIGETNLTLYNRNDKINNMKKGDKYSYAPHFVTKDDALYQKAVISSRPALRNSSSSLWVYRSSVRWGYCSASFSSPS